MAPRGSGAAVPLTHPDGPTRGMQLNGAQLFWMANAVAVVVEVGLLRELGFDDDTRAALLGRSQQYQNLLGQLQEHLNGVL